MTSQGGFLLSFVDWIFEASIIGLGNYFSMPINQKWIKKMHSTSLFYHLGRVLQNASKVIKNSIFSRVLKYGTKKLWHNQGKFFKI